MIHWCLPLAGLTDVILDAAQRSSYYVGVRRSLPVNQWHQSQPRRETFGINYTSLIGVFANSSNGRSSENSKKIRASIAVNIHQKVRLRGSRYWDGNTIRPVFFGSVVPSSERRAGIKLRLDPARAGCGLRACGAEGWNHS